MPLFLQVLKFSCGCSWGLPLRYNAGQTVMVSDVSKALFFFKLSGKITPWRGITEYIPILSPKIIGWWFTSFVDACHGVWLRIGRQIYSEFSKFLPEITFPLPRMHVWEFCPWKGILYYSVCEDKYRDRCATWGFKHDSKNPPRENWICNYFSRLRAGRTGFRILGEERVFFSPKVFRPTLWSTQTPVQWVTGILLLG
jgi:hypothetical protein